MHMFKLGSAPQIPDLFGRVTFSEADISQMEEDLDRAGVDMPQFRSLGTALASADQGGGDTKRMAQVKFTLNIIYVNILYVNIPYVNIPYVNIPYVNILYVNILYVVFYALLYTD